VPTDPQLLPAPRKHFLLLLSAAVRLHQQPPATPGETHTCSSSSQLPPHFSSASGASPHFNRSFSPSVSSTATERSQQATSPSPSTSAHRPPAPWSSDQPPEEEETGSAVKQNRPLLVFFCVLQVVVFLTAGREGKRRRKQGRSAHFRASSVTVARCSTRRHCCCDSRSVSL